MIKTRKESVEEVHSTDMRLLVLYRGADVRGRWFIYERTLDNVRGPMVARYDTEWEARAGLRNLIELDEAVVKSMESSL